MTPVPESRPKPQNLNFEAVRATISATLFGQDVFISYSSADKAWAEAIHHLLTSSGYRVFWDDQAVHSGDELEKILEEVSRSTCLVVLVSASSSESTWVPREIQAHLKRPRKRWRLIPVFLDAVTPSNMPVGSEALAGFHGIQMSSVAASPAEAKNNASLLAELTEQFSRFAHCNNPQAGLCQYRGRCRHGCNRPFVEEPHRHGSERTPPEGRCLAGQIGVSRCRTGPRERVAHQAGAEYRAGLPPGTGATGLAERGKTCAGPARDDIGRWRGCTRAVLGAPQHSKRCVVAHVQEPTDRDPG